MTHRDAGRDYERWTLPAAVTGDDVRAVKYLRKYFHGEGRSAPYTGSYFERLFGGGDAPGVADRFTPEDFLAVSMMSVNVPALSAIRLLFEQAGETSALLRQIPSDLDLVDAKDEIAPGSPADQLWNLLREPKDGLGPTITSKLLARKRPRLVPITDAVVKVALSRTGDEYWVPLRELMAADNRTMHTRMLGLRRQAEIPDHVSAIRVFDVLIWMHGKASSAP